MKTKVQKCKFMIAGRTTKHSDIICETILNNVNGRKTGLNGDERWKKQCPRCGGLNFFATLGD